MQKRQTDKLKRGQIDQTNDKRKRGQTKVKL